jgi:hypothetical protein
MNQCQRDFLKGCVVILAGALFAFVTRNVPFWGYVLIVVGMLVVALGIVMCVDAVERSVRHGRKRLRVMV